MWSVAKRDWGNICEESFAATSLLLTNSLEKNILVGRLSGNRLLSEIIARPFIPPMTMRLSLVFIMSPGIIDGRTNLFCDL